MTIRWSEECLVCAVNLVNLSIFHVNVSAVLRLYLVLSFRGSTICKLLVVEVCPGSMEMSVCIIGREDIVFGSKDTGIIVFLYFINVESKSLL